MKRSKLGLICLVVMLSNFVVVIGQTGLRKMTIAAVFDEGGDRKHELAFRHAVQAVNRNRYIMVLACNDQVVTEIQTPEEFIVKVIAANS